jgi:hypothetical protein
MDDYRRVEFIDVELAGNTEITSPVEKVVAGHSDEERERVEGKTY